MDVDVYQLPIPDWGLACSSCGYPICGLMSHRCPECGFEFDMLELIQPYDRIREPEFSGQELPLPDFGLTCEHCDQPLVGAIDRCCPHCGEAIDPSELEMPAEWFRIDREMTGGLSSGLVEAILADELIPHMTSEEAGLRAIFGHGWEFLRRVRVSGEFYFDFLHAIERERKRLKENREAAEHEWKCPGCGEENPSSFEVCWQCDAPRND